MNPIIKVENLKKTFGDNKVVDGVSFEVYPEEIHCVLGPNGAGKSTTINILTTAMR